MQGGLWNQYTDPKNVMKFIHETKTKYEDKNNSKMIQNAQLHTLYV